MIIVDDESAMRESVQVWVENLGHKVIGMAINGKQALEMITALKPDLVITDIKMPEMDGLTLMEQATKDNDIPFVIVTGLSDGDSIRRAAEGSAFSYLVKPIGEMDLRPAIAIAISRAKEIEFLEKSLKDRKIIEQAKGLLMKSHGISEEQSFRNLQKMARDADKKLIDAAIAVVGYYGFRKEKSK